MLVNISRQIIKPKTYNIQEYLQDSWLGTPDELTSFLDSINGDNYAKVKRLSIAFEDEQQKEELSKLFDIEKAKLDKRVFQSKADLENDFEAITLDFQTQEEALRIFSPLKDTLKNIKLFYKELKLDGKEIIFEYSRLGYDSESKAIKRSRQKITLKHGAIGYDINYISKFIAQEVMKIDRNVLFISRQGNVEDIYSANEVLGLNEEKYTKARDTQLEIMNIVKNENTSQRLEQRGSNRVNQNSKLPLEKDKVKETLNAMEIIKDGKVNFSEMKATILAQHTQKLEQAEKEALEYSQMSIAYLSQGKTLKEVESIIGAKAKNEYTVQFATKLAVDSLLQFKDLFNESALEVQRLSSSHEEITARLEVLELGMQKATTAFTNAKTIIFERDRTIKTLESSLTQSNLENETLIQKSKNSEIMLSQKDELISKQVSKLTASSNKLRASTKTISKQEKELLHQYEVIEGLKSDNKENIINELKEKLSQSEKTIDTLRGENNVYLKILGKTEIKTIEEVESL